VPKLPRMQQFTYNTNNIVLETAREGTTGTGLLAGRYVLPGEIIAVFGNAINLQDRGLVQEFTKLSMNKTWTNQLEGSSIPSFIRWRGIHTLQWLYLISTGN